MATIREDLMTDFSEEFIEKLGMDNKTKYNSVKLFINVERVKPVYFKTASKVSYNREQKAKELNQDTLRVRQIREITDAIKWCEKGSFLEKNRCAHRLSKMIRRGMCVSKWKFHIAHSVNYGKFVLDTSTEKQVDIKPDYVCIEVIFKMSRKSSSHILV